MKKAVAFVLDSSISMLKPYPSSSLETTAGTTVKSEETTTATTATTTTTRLDSAKHAIQLMISDLMLQSITNEVCVVVCKTEKTKHHKMACINQNDADMDNRNDIPFQNLTELTYPEGMKRPTVQLLRQLAQVQPSSLSSSLSSSTTNDKQSLLRGDIIDGIILATDAMYERTYKRKYERQIIVVTDAEHTIILNTQQLLVIIDTLRTMECKIRVIGINFQHLQSTQTVFVNPAPVPSTLTTTAPSATSIVKVKVEEEETHLTKETADIPDDDAKSIVDKKDDAEIDKEESSVNENNVQSNVKDESDTDDDYHEYYRRKRVKHEDVEEDKTKKTTEQVKNEEVDENNANNTKNNYDENSINEQDSDNGNDNDNDDGIIEYTSQYDREMLLVSLTEKTGGEVIVVSTLTDLLNANQGKRIQMATKRKVILQIGPKLQIDARYILIMKKLSQETLKTEAIIEYETNKYNDDDDDITRNNSRRSLYNDTDKNIKKEVKIEDYNEDHKQQQQEHHVPEIVTDKIESIVQYVDAKNNPDTVIDPKDITYAIRYGSSLIPMSSFDFTGLHSVYTSRRDDSDNDNDLDYLQSSNEPRMEILGYMERCKVLSIYLQGPPYCISGNTSQKSCAVLSALAQSLYTVQKVAIVLFFKTKNSTEPILGTLFPYRIHVTPANDLTVSTTTTATATTPKNKLPLYPMHLLFLQIPFAGDIKKLTMANIEEQFFNTHDPNDSTEAKVHHDKVSACDQLVDSLLLPVGTLDSGTVPSPFVRSWNQTKMKRAIYNNSTTSTSSSKPIEIVNVRQPSSLLSNTTTSISTCDDDPMSTPSMILTNAQGAVTNFQKVFPIQLRKSRQKQQSSMSSTIEQQQQKQQPSTSFPGRKVVTYKDYLPT